MAASILVEHEVVPRSSNVACWRVAAQLRSTGNVRYLTRSCRKRQLVPLLVHDLTWKWLGATAAHDPQTTCAGLIDRLVSAGE